MKHELKYCPRCNSTFECKVGSVVLCQCSAVKLNQEERDYINNKYEDCLCAACIESLRSEYNQEKFRLKLKKIGYGF